MNPNIDVRPNAGVTSTKWRGLQIGLRSQRFYNGESWFDRQVLEKIIINLISNSFKYSSDPGIITVDVLTSLEDFKPAFENV